VTVPVWAWAAFAVFVLAMLILGLYPARSWPRRASSASTRPAVSARTRRTAGSMGRRASWPACQVPAQVRYRMSTTGGVNPGGGRKPWAWRCSVTITRPRSATSRRTTEIRRAGPGPRRTRCSVRRPEAPEWPRGC